MYFDSAFYLFYYIFILVKDSSYEICWNLKYSKKGLWCGEIGFFVVKKIAQVCKIC